MRARDRPSAASRASDDSVNGILPAALVGGAGRYIALAECPEQANAGMNVRALAGVDEILLIAPVDRLAVDGAKSLIWSENVSHGLLHSAKELRDWGAVPECDA